MRRVITWSLGIVLLLAAAVALWARGAGISAVHARVWPFEAPVARAAWRYLVPADVRHASNPVAPTPEVLTAGRDHWADHCASCHANDGSGDTPVGRRMYPRAPDIRAQHTQRLTDGELFYAIEQGVPWTGMPGWSTGTPAGANESWGLVHFIRHLPSISADELREMETRNPRAPVDEQREKAIEDFLGGAPEK
jgi:mono/diheme cytochrome c family protein